MNMKYNIKIDSGDVEEVFEILCEIPFEQPTMYDSEPPTERHPGIESIIKQLAILLD